MPSRYIHQVPFPPTQLVLTLSISSNEILLRDLFIPPARGLLSSEDRVDCASNPRGAAYARGVRRSLPKNAPTQHADADENEVRSSNGGSSHSSNVGWAAARTAVRRHRSSPSRSL